MLNTVAIIGRPNVGKSTLFNKLTKSRSAIVSNFSGLTKDRNYGLLSIGDSKTFLIDTGGIDSSKQESIDNKISEQAWIAVDESSLVLFVIDGVRMNNAIYRSGHVHNAISIDANSLERTEVIFGPSSVAYGSDALGGVIHFYTKTPRLNKDEFFDYTKSISYNFKDQSKVNNYSLELSKKNWASYTSYTKSDFGDVHMGKVRNHGYNDWGLVNYYTENINGKFYENQSLNNNPNLQRNTAYKQKDFIQKFNFKIFKTDKEAKKYLKSLNINKVLENVKNYNEIKKIISKQIAQATKVKKPNKVLKKTIKSIKNFTLKKMIGGQCRLSLKFLYEKVLDFFS